MTIRAAVATDIPGILALWNDLICNTLATFNAQTHSPEGLSAILEARPDAFWVHGDPVDGFVTWSQFRGGVGYRFTVEHTVIVKPGQGIGTALMHHALQEATKQGYHSMMAGISGANLAAVRFHQRIGFEKVGHLPQVGHKAGQWLDLILMQKLLDAT